MKLARGFNMTALVLSLSMNLFATGGIGFLMNGYKRKSDAYSSNPIQATDFSR
jgi:hypothetical protein